MTNSEVQSIFQEAISMCEAVGYKPQKLYPVCKINSRKKHTAFARNSETVIRALLFLLKLVLASIL